MTDIRNQFCITMNAQYGAVNMQGIFHLTSTASQKINGTLPDIPAIVGIGHQVKILYAMFKSRNTPSHNFSFYTGVYLPVTY